MATIYNGGNVELLSGKVAILGFGSQGHAHALNLHESGVDVMVGLRPGSASRDAAESAGLAVGTVAEAVAGAQLVAVLLPDQVQKRVYDEEVALEPRRRRRARCSRTASTCTTAGSRRPPATT